MHGILEVLPQPISCETHVQNTNTDSFSFLSLIIINSKKANVISCKVIGNFLIMIMSTDKVCIIRNDDEHCGVNLSTSIYCT